MKLAVPQARPSRILSIASNDKLQDSIIAAMMSGTTTAATFAAATTTTTTTSTSTSTRHWADRLPTVGVALAAVYSIFTSEMGSGKVSEMRLELDSCDKALCAAKDGRFTAGLRGKTAKARPGRCFLLSKPCDSPSRKRFALPSSFVADFVVLHVFGTGRNKTRRIALGSLSRPLTHTLSCVFSPR